MTSTTNTATASGTAEEKLQAQRALRAALGSFITGVTVVTARDAQGVLAGCTANSFSSVSLDPPLVLWSLARSARSYEVFAASDRFTINFLSEGQRDLSQLFASQGSDKFGSARWTPGLGGVPVIDDALCHFECSKYASYPGGDHTIFVGQVEHFARKPNRPLVFGGGRYMTAIDDFPASASRELREGNRARFEAERLAVALLPEISRQVGRSVAVAMWGNEGPVVLYWVVNSDPISEGIQTGHVCSLPHTATGQAFAAYLPPEVTARIRAAHLARSDWTETAFDHALAEVRAKGRALVASAETGLISLSAPVYDESGLMMLALTTVMPLSATNESHTSHQLIAQARELSSRLGFKDQAA